MVDSTDPFATRYGYIPGRCNAYRHLAGHAPKTDGLCKSYPSKRGTGGRRRCARHGGGWGLPWGRKVKPPKVEPPLTPGLLAECLAEVEARGPQPPVTFSPEKPKVKRDHRPYW